MYEFLINYILYSEWYDLWKLLFLWIIGDIFNLLYLIYLADESDNSKTSPHSSLIVELNEEFKYNHDLIKIDEYFQEEKLVKSKSEIAPHFRKNNIYYHLDSKHVNTGSDDQLNLKVSNNNESEDSLDFDDNENIK